MTEDAFMKKTLHDLMQEYPDTGFVLIRSRPVKEANQMNQRAWSNVGNKDALKEILENEAKMVYIGEN